MDNRKMTELDEESLDQVTGGVTRYINTGIVGTNAAIRADSCKSSAQIDSLPNTFKVDTVTDDVVRDNVSGRNYVYICYVKNGVTRYGWVAASIVGLPR